MKQNNKGKIMNNEILVFDAETNGLPKWKEPSDSSGQPHIVQLAALEIDTDKMTVTNSMNVIVKPDNWIIEDETIKIHGITNEYANDVGIPEADAIGTFMALLGDKLRIAHNTTFDNRMIRIALKRMFSEELADEFKAKPYYCTMINSRKQLELKKNPSLDEAYQMLVGHEITGRIDSSHHDALIDSQAAAEIYFRLHDMEYAEDIFSSSDVDETKKDDADD